MSDTPRTNALINKEEWVEHTWRDKFNEAVRLCFALERENAALRCANARWETAVLACVDCANNREDEWGERAVDSFAFLYAAIAAARAKEGGAT